MSKLVVYTEGKRLTLNFPTQEEANDGFLEVITMLLFRNESVECEEVKEEEPQFTLSAINKAREVLRGNHMQADTYIVGEHELEPAMTYPPKPPHSINYSSPAVTGYSGFLFLKCPHCGNTKGFCTKVPVTTSHCKVCGGDFDLKDLKKMTVLCECGRPSSYKTNMDEAMFDFNCLYCGAPVPIKYNEDKDRYDTILPPKKHY